MISVRLQRKVERKIDECLEVLQRHYGCRFVRPEINYTAQEKIAGQAIYNSNTICFNSVLLVENENDFINRTVPHELAHLIAYQIHGFSGLMRNGEFQHHGEEWRSVMKLLSVDDSVYHSYLTEHAKLTAPQHLCYNDVINRDEEMR